MKAFNIIYYHHLRDQAHRDCQLRAITFAGDQKEALNMTKKLIKEIGFDPVYVGKLSESHLMDVDQPLYNKDLTAEEIRQIPKTHE